MQPEQNRSRTSARRGQVALGMLLILLPLLLYLPVLHHDFLRLWDDDAYVLDNPHVRTGLTLANVRWAFTSFEQSNWHPVTWLSHMLDCQLFGLNAEAQHAVACVVIGLCVTTARYLRDWQDPVTLFAHARTSWGRPDMWLEQLYGNALFSAGRIDEAFEHYQASCAIQPRTEYCHYNIAHILAGRGQFRDAIREYDFALEYTANRDMALLCLNERGEAELQIGDYVAAENSVTRALAIDPANSVTQQLRQQILQRKGGAH